MRGVTMSPVEKVRPAGVTGRRRREAIVKKNALPRSAAARSPTSFPIHLGNTQKNKGGENQRVENQI